MNTREHRVLTPNHPLPAVAAFSKQAGSHPCHLSCGPGHVSCSDQGCRGEGVVCPPPHKQRLRRRHWCPCLPAGAATTRRTGPRDRLLHQSCVPRGAAREPDERSPAGAATAAGQTHGEKQTCESVEHLPQQRLTGVQA